MVFVSIYRRDALNLKVSFYFEADDTRLNIVLNLLPNKL